VNHLLDFIETWRTQCPDRVAFTLTDLRGSIVASHTYASFHSRASVIAERLVDLGVELGDRVLLAYPTGLESLAAFVGAVMAGALPVPVPARGDLTRAPGIAAIGNDCGAVLGLTTTQVVDRWQSRVGASNGRARWVPSDVWPDTVTCRAPRHVQQNLFIQYTSGSTSRPKGVLITNKNVVHNCHALLDHRPIGVSWLPQHHDMGLIGYGLFPLIMGGSAHLMSASDFLRRPALWFETITRTAATWTSSPNFGLDYCLRPDRLPDSALEGVNLSSLRILMNAAERVRPATQRRFTERFTGFGLSAGVLVASYGLAENTLAVTHGGRRYERRPGGGQDVASCGRALSGVSVAVMDPSTSVALSDGEVGEIVVSGPSVASGYWNAGSEAPSSISPSLRTGDLGFIDKGELFVCGRNKNMVCIRGRNIYAEDLEACVEELMGYAAAGRVAALCGERDESVSIVIEVSGATRRADLKRVARACVLRVGVMPSRVVLARPGVIAHTTSGKLARHETQVRLEQAGASLLESYLPDLHEDDDITVVAAGLRDLVTSLAVGQDGAKSLADSGVDSLTMVEIALLVDGIFAQRGVESRLDTQVLSALRLEDLPPLIDLALGGTIEEVSARIESLARDAQERDAVFMAADAQRSATRRLCDTGENGRLELSRVIMTGPTGALGPFFLERLLALTDADIDVVVRAPTASTAEGRVADAVRGAGLWNETFAERWRRVRFHPGDIRAKRWGLQSCVWDMLARKADAILHNAAEVNYVATYAGLRAANVEGTRTALELAALQRAKRVLYVSSTVIYGWSRAASVTEDEHNAALADLTFGYAQSKCVAEHLVHQARQDGLLATIYRPSFVTPARGGRANETDVVVRLLTFMLKNRIGLSAPNQVSVLPADHVAHNSVALMVQGCAAGVFNLTSDDYYTLEDVTRVMSQECGYRFNYLGMGKFLSTLREIARRDDPVFPLLDFFESSRARLEAMEHKRYCNRRYREARMASSLCMPEPPLRDTVTWLVAAMERAGLVESESARVAPL
jgi:thioester reductase-like protein